MAGPSQVTISITTSSSPIPNATELAAHSAAEDHAQ